MLTSTFSESWLPPFSPCSAPICNEIRKLKGGTFSVLVWWLVFYKRKKIEKGWKWRGSSVSRLLKKRKSGMPGGGATGTSTYSHRHVFLDNVGRCSNERDSNVVTLILKILTSVQLNIDLIYFCKM